MADALDFELDTLKDWLTNETGENAAITVVPMRGGGSCEMFEMSRTVGNGAGTERWVIRRAPASAVSSTAHNVVREYKVISAMHGSDVRVPELLAVGEDTEILGTPFYIMRFIDGEVIRRKLPEQYLASPETQPSIGEELIDALIELHDFDWRGTAIETLAKPEKFLERQVDRWMQQLAGYRDRDLPGVDAVAKWLDDNRPAATDLTVMHGDYKVDNTIYSREVPPRIVTLVDFEMTTVGAPLIDLAWAMIFWPEEGSLIAMAAPGTEGGMDAAYCQAPQTLIDRYGERSGRDLGDFQWYQAFAAWKLAIVLEASYAKFLQGESKNPSHEFFGFLVDQLLLRAQRFAV